MLNFIFLSRALWGISKRPWGRPLVLPARLEWTELQKIAGDPCLHTVAKAQRARTCSRSVARYPNVFPIVSFFFLCFMIRSETTNHDDLFSEKPYRDWKNNCDLT